MDSNSEQCYNIPLIQVFEEETNSPQQQKHEEQEAETTRIFGCSGRKRRNPGKSSSVQRKKKTTETGQTEEEKDDEEEVKQDISEDAKKLITARTTPKNLFLAVRELKTHQIKCLKKIGFEQILEMKINVIPSKLANYIIKNFDTEKMVITTAAGDIKVDEEAVSQILGLKNEGVHLNEIETGKDWETVLSDWKIQYDNVKHIRTSDILKKLRDCNDTEWTFKTNFIMLFVNSMATSMKMGSCNLSIVSKLEKNMDFGQINWCRYIIDCAKESKTGWNQECDETVYTGPITFLTLLYLDSTTCHGLNHERMSPATKWWTSEKMKMREKKELTLGGFGMGSLKEYKVEGKGRKQRSVKQKKTLKELLSKLNNSLEELQACKEEIDCNLNEAIKLYPKSRHLKKWKETYEKSFQFKQKEMVEEEKENENEDKQKEEKEKKATASEQTVTKEACLEIVLDFEKEQESKNKAKEERKSEHKQKEIEGEVDENTEDDEEREKEEKEKKEKERRCVGGQKKITKTALSF